MPEGKGWPDVAIAVIDLLKAWGTSAVFWIGLSFVIVISMFGLAAAGELVGWIERLLP